MTDKVIVDRRERAIGFLAAAIDYEHPERANDRARRAIEAIDDWMLVARDEVLMHRPAHSIHGAVEQQRMPRGAPRSAQMATSAAIHTPQGWYEILAETRGIARGFELGVRAAIWWLKDHASHRPATTAQRLVEAAHDIETELLDRVEPGPST